LTTNKIIEVNAIMKRQTEYKTILN